MNKNNRWDHIDPQLQNLYKQQNVQPKDSLRSQLYQEYINPDVINQTMNYNPLTGQNWSTSIPVQKENYTIPYSPYKSNGDYSSLFPDKENRPLTRFTDGVKQYGERIANDFSYNIGLLKSRWNKEDYMQDAYQNVKNNFGDLSSLSNNDLLNEIKKTQQDISQRISGEIKPQMKNGLYDPETGSRTIQIYLNTKRRYLDALKNILGMRENGLPPQQINQYIDDYITHGGEGKKQMHRALEKNDNFKETQGWAKVGEIGSGIVQQALPIAAGLIFPPAGIALGGANVGCMTAQSHAQANMDVDRYEAETGKEVPDMDRVAYVGAYTGADLLAQGLMQGRYLNKLAVPLKESVRKNFISQMMRNPKASKELTDLLRNYKNIDMRKLTAEVGSDASMEGLSEAGTSVAQDMANMIYKDKERFPTLNEILYNAARSGIEGGVLGGTLGGISNVGGKAVQQLRRKNQGNITILNNLYDSPMEVLGKDKSGMYKVITPDGEERLIYPDFVESIYSIPYDEYNRITRTSAEEYEKMPDLMDRERLEIGRIPTFGPSIANPNNPWTFAPNNDRLKGKRRQEAERISRELGLDAQIYDRQTELPLDVQNELLTKDVLPGYFSPEDNQVNIILDNIRTEAEFRKTLLREAIAKKGIRALYGDHTDSFLDKVFRSMPKEAQDSYTKNNQSKQKAAEEYLSDIAEKGVDNPGLWNGIRSYTREIMRDRFGKDYDFNDNELQYILWKARNRITNKDSMKEMRDKNKREQQILKSMFPTQYPPKDDD